jgi:tRNA pseudouridine55 synthase
MRLNFDSNTDWKEGVVLLFDKPFEWTSFNLVSKVKSLLYHRLGYKKIKVGHAGTLDPLATGLLIVCVGKATKQINLLQDMEKEYIAKFELGATTPSFDLETTIDQRYPTDHITIEAIQQVANNFLGAQMQVPPLFSAKMVEGGRAYKLARKGVDMELPPSPIVISSMEIIDFNMPYVTIKIRCSKGTYIRALARDFGKALNSGAHMVELERTAIGEFQLANAMTISQFEKIISPM